MNRPVLPNCTRITGTVTTRLDSTQPLRNPWDRTPMDAPNHADQPPASTPASSSPTAGHDPSDVAQDQDPTQLLTKLLVDTTLTVPTDNAPNHIDQTPSSGDSIIRILKSEIAKGKAPLTTLAAPPPNTFTLPTATRTSFPMASGNNPVAASDHDAIIELLAKLVGEGEPVRPTSHVPVAPPQLLNRAAPRALITERALQAAGCYGFGGAATERTTRRREGRRVFKVPTDYLRAVQERRERRRRRTVVRRNVRVLLSIHEDRASERGLSAMMARLATREPVVPAAEDATAPSSTEHDELGELLVKMELSFKD
ncbi:unnamed protein product [Urochloa humidicola]